MALPVTHFTHGGRDYYTTLLPATEALVLLPKLITLLGESVTSIALLAKGYFADGASVDLFDDPVTLGAIVTQIAKASSENDGLLLLRELLRHTECGQVRLAEGSVIRASAYDNFDALFSGDLLGMIMVCVKAAQASFVKPSGV